MTRRRTSLARLLLARIALALSLLAPHAGHAGQHQPHAGPTMVICGADGPFTVALDVPAPSRATSPDLCCIMGCVGLTPSASIALPAWARPADPPAAAAPPPAPRLADGPNARDPPMTR